MQYTRVGLETLLYVERCHGICEISQFCQIVKNVSRVGNRPRMLHCTTLMIEYKLFVLCSVPQHFCIDANISILAIFANFRGFKLGLILEI